MELDPARSDLGGRIRTDDVGDAWLATAASDLRLQLDSGRGLPISIGRGERPESIPLRFEVELETDGVEVRGPVGGVEYEQTTRRSVDNLVEGSFEHRTTGARECIAWLAEASGWLVRFEVWFEPDSPEGELYLSASPAGDTGPSVLRELRILITLAVPDPESWLIEAPGNTLRSGVVASELGTEIYVLTIGGEEGSPGLVGLHSPEHSAGVLLWPFSRSESGKILLSPSGGTVTVAVETELAGAVSPGEWLDWGPLRFDVFERSWDEILNEVQDWYEHKLGVKTPVDRPEWVNAVNLYEVQLGSGPHWGGWRYEPYPTLADLRNDLDRIAEKGFQLIQLLPKHPYPGYALHYPGDIDITYWEKNELREFVDECHKRGIRVILDIVCVYAIDKQVIRESVEAIKAGPYGDRLEEPSPDAMSPIHVSEDIPTCRLVLAQADDWIAGAPERQPLLDEHPEWFMRNSDGEVTAVFCHALAIANREWQDVLVESCAQMVHELGIDGFRYDTPMYNRFHDWSERARRHASYNGLAALELYRKMRRRLHEIDPELIMYVEPSSPFFRESVDITYPYEESWLIQSVFNTDPGEGREWRRVRNGRELSRWMRDFEKALPRGSVTVHHVDIHDVWWWPLPGQRFRREQIGLPATKAALSIYGLRGGGLMTGALCDEGYEDELRLVHRLRSELPEIREGEVDYDSVEASHDAVFAVLRSHRDRRAVVLVNTVDEKVVTDCTVDLAGAAGPDGEVAVYDAWAGTWRDPAAVVDGRAQLRAELAPYQTTVLLFVRAPVSATEQFAPGP